MTNILVILHIRIINDMIYIHFNYFTRMMMGKSARIRLFQQFVNKQNNYTSSQPIISFIEQEQISVLAIRMKRQV